MAQNDIVDDKPVPETPEECSASSSTENVAATPITVDESASPLEKALYLWRSDRVNWFLILLTCLVIVVTFHKPFQWMLNMWFAVEENSPGPVVPVLLTVILWSQLRKMKYKPVYQKSHVYVLLTILITLSTIAYLGKNYKNSYPQYEIYGKIAFDVLFLVLNFFLIYAAYLFMREYRLNLGESKAAVPERISLGMVAIVFALILHFLGMRGDQDRISILSYLMLMFGLTWFVFGNVVAKKLIFPYAILFFMMPMEFLDDYIGGPMRIQATNVSVWVMQKLSLVINMEVIQSGTKFTVDGKPFDVAPACSGLRSLVALTIIGGSYAYISQPTVLRKWLLGLCAIPIALFTNIIRLVLVGLTCHFFGSERALWVHDNAIFLYILAIIIFFSLDKVFDRIAQSKWFKRLIEFMKARFKWLKVKDF
jgi:exosortase